MLVRTYSGTNAERFTLNSEKERVFTTCVSKKNGEGLCIPFLRSHIERVTLHAEEALGIRKSDLPSKDTLLTSVTHAAATFSTPCIVRIVISQESVAIFANAYTPPWSATESISVISVRGERKNPQWKSTDAAVSVQAREIAHSKGAHEGILIDSRGVVREGAWSNLFWITNEGVLCTTATAILPGITRAALLSLYPVRLIDSTKEALEAEADEMFITQSTTGITSVGSFDGTPIQNKGKTEEIKKRFALFSIGESTPL